MRSTPTVLRGEVEREEESEGEMEEYMVVVPLSGGEEIKGRMAVVVLGAIP